MIYAPFIKIPQLEVDNLDDVSVSTLKPVVQKIVDAIIDASAPLRVSVESGSTFVPASNKSFTCPICSGYNKAQDLLPVEMRLLKDDSRQIFYTKGKSFPIYSDLPYYEYLDSRGPLHGSKYADFCDQGIMDVAYLNKKYVNYKNDINEAIDGVVKDIADRIVLELNKRLSVEIKGTENDENINSWASVAMRNPPKPDKQLDLSLSGIFKELMYNQDNILYSSVIACAFYTFSIKLCQLRIMHEIPTAHLELVSKINKNEFPVVKDNELEFGYSASDARVDFEDVIELLSMFPETRKELSVIGQVVVVRNERLLVMTQVEDLKFKTSFKSRTSSPTTPRMLSDLIEAQLGVS